MPEEPETDFYMRHCRVVDIVDGDTIDVEIDLGFEMSMRDRLRVKGVDTAEIHNTDRDSVEFQRGMKHAAMVDGWVDSTQLSDLADDDYPFLLRSEEFNRGAFGRIVGDLYSPIKDEWISDRLIREFDDVEDT